MSAGHPVWGRGAGWLGFKPQICHLYKLGDLEGVTETRFPICAMGPRWPRPASGGLCAVCETVRGKLLARGS